MMALDLMGLGLPTTELLSWGGVTVLRATIVLTGAFGISMLLRRTLGSAQTEHALWTATLASLLLLPALSPFLPRIPVPIPTAVAGVAEHSAEPDPGFRLDVTPAGVVETGTTARPRELRAEAQPLEGTIGSVLRHAPRAAPAAGWGSLDVPGVLILVWLLGATALGTALGLGLFSSVRLCRSARATRDRKWLREFAEARRSVGLMRPVRLRFSERVRTGMAGGFLRPVVLLPDEARRWTAERRRIVLLHELVHLKRRDPVRKVCGRIALAVYWFHPLAWYAIRRASLVREEACDEAVISLGQRPSVYARHLLDLADPAPLPMPALSRIDRPHLEKRIMRILHTPVRPASRSTLLVAGLAVAWALVVGSMGPQPVPAVAAQAPADTISPPPPPSAPPPPVRASPAPEIPPVPEIRPSPEVPANPQVPPVPDVRPASPPAPVEPPPVPAHQEPRCRPGGQEAQEDTASGESEGVMTRGSNWIIRRTLDGFTLCMRTHGDVTFADGGAVIESLGPDAWVVLASEGEGAERRVEIFPAEAALRHRWFVNGAERPFDDEAREWLDAMLEVLGADARLRGEIARVRGEEALFRGQAARIGEEAAARQARVAALQGQIALAEAQARIEALDTETTVQEIEARMRGLEEALAASRVSDLIREVEARLEALVDTQRRIERVRQRLEPAEARLLAILNRMR